MSQRRVVPFVLAGLAAAGLFVLRDEAVRAADSPFENVEVATEVQSKREMRALMKEQAKSLGVKCTHCHVKGEFALEDKEEKRVGREMMRMVREINEKYFPEGEGISCWTCHRGSTEPEMERPAGAGEGDSFEAVEE